MFGTIEPPTDIDPVGRPIVPDKITWLASEMFKIRVAHG